MKKWALLQVTINLIEFILFKMVFDVCLFIYSVSKDVGTQKA